MKSFMFYTTFFILYLCIGRLGHADIREVVAVVDTGMPTSSKYATALCDSGHKDFTGYGITDVLGHGTSIVDIISSRMDYTKYCIKIYKWFHTYEKPNKYGHNNTTHEYLKELLRTNPSLINLSLSGIGTFDIVEFEAYRSLARTGSVLVVSAGNDKLYLNTGCNVYPSCYPINNTNFRVVGSATGTLVDSFSNFGPLVTNYENGTSQVGSAVYQGTSQAAATLTGKLTSVKVDTRGK
jgi:Subtilase family